jgi:hypothetical protein
MLTKKTKVGNFRANLRIKFVPPKNLPYQVTFYEFSVYMRNLVLPAKSGSGMALYGSREQEQTSIFKT